MVFVSTIVLAVIIFILVHTINSLRYQEQLNWYEKDLVLGLKKSGHCTTTMVHAVTDVDSAH